VGLLHTLTDPRISRHLLRDEGEVIVDEVRHHWIVYVVPMLAATVGLALIVWVPFLRTDLGWAPFLLGTAFIGYAGLKALGEHMDRFVVTNMRVFRAKGVFAQQLATMPLSRVVDITVRKPLHGRMLGFGHFVFESAAQEQGLRDIRFVPHPDRVDLEIQRLVQRTGLRGGPRVN
jgi:hypothetical protein